MRFGSLLLLISLTMGLLLSGVPVYSLHAADFKVNISPTSKTLQRGSSFWGQQGFAISVSGGPTGTKVQVSATISPSVTNGPSFTITQYDIAINSFPTYLEGTTSTNTPTAAYTFTVTAQGIQAPLVGVVETATCTLTVT